VDDRKARKKGTGLFEEAISSTKRAEKSGGSRRGAWTTETR